MVAWPKLETTRMTEASTKLLNPPSRERADFILRRYRGANGKFYWLQISRANGQPVGMPAQGGGFERKIDCLINMYLVTGWDELDEDLDKDEDEDEDAGKPS